MVTPTAVKGMSHTVFNHTSFSLRHTLYLSQREVYEPYGISRLLTTPVGGEGFESGN